MRVLLLFLTAVIMGGCSPATGDDTEAKEAARAWADAYFNCDYNDAAQYATPESRKWLAYAATNTTEEELQRLNDAGGATVSMNDGFEAANDTLRQVTVTVSNALIADGQGLSAPAANEAVCRVTVVRREGRWMVRMEGLPQSGMQSRD